jgi:hypothetical protein
MESPLYAVCPQCAFLRGFARRPLHGEPPERCPACGSEMAIHPPYERYPSTYVGRISRKLYATPPLRA